MHVDMDAFFAAVEQRDNPELRGKPVIIGAMPGGRGVVSTCSYEARKFGLHSAMPIGQAHKRCPQGIYLRPDMKKYAAVSQQVMDILASISPVVEPLGIDEAFLDITGLDRLIGTAEQVGYETKRRIQQQLQLTASVGIGPNRLIAKIASDFRKPDGLTLVPPDGVQAFLDPLPVSSLRGVGPRMVKALEKLGIKRVAQLRAWPKAQLYKRFGETGGEHLYRQARGIASDIVGEREMRKSVSKEVTFGEDVTEAEVLRETLLALAGEVGRIARKENLCGKTVTLKIRLAGFETHTKQCKVEQGTNSDRRIFQCAWSLYHESGHAGRPVRLIGVGISDWERDSERQLDMFVDENKERDLFAAVDQITDRFGKGAIRMGGSGNVEKKDEGDN